ncbi:MAG TPA: deoxynucleoside kinase [Candidatus Eisenbacteria bacterium]|nr:deoxynucleoside kinase [Candidatus Eisenbacteria bacterium]
MSNATESLAPKPGPRGYFLAIAGNIGVGKTELTDRLSRELGWYAYYEPVIQNPYLDAFYADMSRWAFHLQIYFLSERFKAQVTIGESVGAFIQDRTIYEDREIFARTLHEQGDMTRVDFENYTALFDCMVSFLRKPDLILYLKASPETLMDRIARRGRESEKSITLEYLSRLGRAYDEWMESAAGLYEVKVLDTDRVPLQGPTPAFHDLVEDLKRRFPPQIALDLDRSSSSAPAPAPTQEPAPEHARRG